MPRKIQIADRIVGQGAPCFIIAEVALAHEGSLGMAFAFIDAAATTGADAVKFQAHIADAESSVDEPFRVQGSSQDRSRADYWRRTGFTPDQWAVLARRASDRGLVFLCSPFSVEAVDLLEKIGIPAWKIGSGEVSNPLLLDRVARTGSPVLLSSGMSPYSELDAAVERLRTRQAGVGIFQCTTAYPCPPERVGLNVLEELRDRYDAPVGLSDHSGTPYAAMAAATLGASMVEVHITLSRAMYGPDVPASLTPEEFTRMVEGIRFIERAQASPVDKDAVAGESAHLRSIFTKGLVAARDLPAGRALGAGDLSARKPAKGIPAACLDVTLGRRLRRPLVRGQFIFEEDLE